MAVDIDTTAVQTALNKLQATNADDGLAPEWLNSDFLEEHLKNFFDNTQLKIVSFELKPATAKGENYASTLYRVKVVFSNEVNTCSGRRNSVSGKWCQTQA